MAYTLGDFNGDGRIDIAYGRTTGSLAVYLGGENELIESKPAHLIELPSFGQARSIALREDSSRDIVLFHPGGDNSKRVEVILFD